jgi:hypothetical protein
VGVGVGDDRTTRCVGERTTAGFSSSAAIGSGAGAGSGSIGDAGSSTTGAVDFVAVVAFLAGAFFGAGSALAAAGSGSGIGSFLRPRLSARRRTRSADGSSMLDEWLFTPILSSFANSTTTALSTPSCRASS